MIFIFFKFADNFFRKQGEDSVEYFLGLTPSGIIVLRNKSTVAHYYWPRIAKVYFKGRFFMLRVCDKNVRNFDLYFSKHVQYNFSICIIFWQFEEKKFYVKNYILVKDTPFLRFGWKVAKLFVF